jgi:hypothetical protein
MEKLNREIHCKNWDTIMEECLKKLFNELNWQLEDTLRYKLRDKIDKMFYSELEVKTYFNLKTQMKHEKSQ